MYIYLSKILPLLVLPVGIVMIGCLTALFLILGGRRRASALVLVLAIAVLWISSMPVVAAALYGRLERANPPLELADIPVGDCIVVLGGGVGLALAPRVEPDLNEASDRIYKAAQLYRHGKGSTIIVSAGNQPWNPSSVSEAEVVRALLVEWGVDSVAIVLDRESRNTRENALNSKSLLEKSRCEAPLLVTSAAHMRRSLAAFAKAGVNAFPVSTDVNVVHSGTLAFLDFLPSAGALSMTTEAMREWIGLKVYEWRGWN